MCVCAGVFVFVRCFLVLRPTIHTPQRGATSATKGWRRKGIAERRKDCVKRCTVEEENLFARNSGSGGGWRGVASARLEDFSSINGG